MKIYVDICDLIIALHEKGFCEDFEILGSKLRWIQEKRTLALDDFLLTECHRMIDGNGQAIEVCTIVSLVGRAKGILVNHYEGYQYRRHPAIQEKISLLAAVIGERAVAGGNLLQSLSFIAN